MKTVKIRSKCSVCGFEIKWDLDVNEYGFFQIPDAYCPNDFILLIQEIDGHIKSIDDPEDL